jgi:integrase
MSRRDFTRIDRPAKPDKPHPDFPLFPHANGTWAKKIRGRLHYFGPWDDPDAAFAKWLSEKDDLLAGRLPRQSPEALTVGGLCGQFLTNRERKLEAGELSRLTFDDYAEVCRIVLRVFGPRRLLSDVRADDFERLRAGFPKHWSPVTVAGRVNRIRCVFNFAYKHGLTDRLPLFGEGFKRPPKTTLRKHRTAQGPRMFEAAEIQRILEAASPVLRAMVMLGINCGFGNHDVGTLPVSALDLDAGWVDFPRGKTGIDRRCPLWPETVAAVRAWLKVRPEPADADDAGLVFVTRKGGRWVKPTTTDNPVSKEFRKLLDGLGMNGHRNFYALRHTFQTIADESGDFVGVRHMMGHAFNGDISAVYRERVSDARLRKVVDTVRQWLFADADMT